MKLSLYFNYTSRSLFRGGQRTILAFFCVAVGVMAIVALQLVGLMINSALTSNVRDANGGDLSVAAGARPFNQKDLNFFQQLKNKETITNYTALDGQSGSFSNSFSLGGSFTVLLVNPQSYPVVTPPSFNSPANGTISALLSDNGVIVDQSFINQYHKQLGDTFTVHI
ncbi:MAG: ABC transporter permease, partial [Ktedonobacteraceae bacterium]